MQPYFSLILPCYNVSAYLRRCVQSILSQEFSDYEIILVDDGATDGTAEICDELAETEQQIRVIHKENGGLSSARNAGLQAAEGQYVWFIDSDDWIQAGALNRLEQSCSSENADIVKFEYFRKQTEMTCVPGVLPEGYYSARHALDDIRRKAFCEPGKYVLSAWSHVYNRRFLEDNRLSFVSERLIGSEDYLFNLQALMCACSLSVLKAPLYVYEERSGSLTQTYKPDLQQRYEALRQHLLKTLPEKYKRLIERFFVWHLIIGTCLSSEYHCLKATGETDKIRARARHMISSREVKQAAWRSDKQSLPGRKKILLLALMMGAEPVFYYLMAVRRHKA